jgi:hypothetical protein
VQHKPAPLATEELLQHGTEQTCLSGPTPKDHGSSFWLWAAGRSSELIKLLFPHTFQVACNLGYAVVVEQQDFQPRQAREALQPHDSIVRQIYTVKLILQCTKRWEAQHTYKQMLWQSVAAGIGLFRHWVTSAARVKLQCWQSCARDSSALPVNASTGHSEATKQLCLL